MHHIVVEIPVDCACEVSTEDPSIMYAYLTEVTITPVEEGVLPAVAIPAGYTVVTVLWDVVCDAGTRPCCSVEP